MKITDHKDGRRSYTFTPAEQAHGSPDAIQALDDMAMISGGIYGMVSDLLQGAEALQLYSNESGPVGLSTEALMIICKIAIRARATPFGQGRWDAALEQLQQEDAITPNERLAKAIFGEKPVRDENLPGTYPYSAQV